MPAPARSRRAVLPALLAAVTTGLTSLLVVAAPPSAAAPPANDNLANATPVSLAAGASTTVALTTAEATKETGEPTPCASITSTVWVAYTPLDTQVLTARTATATPDMDTVLAVYTAPAAAYPLTTPAVACNDDVNGGYLSELTFTATAGTTYYVQVGHYPSQFTSQPTVTGPLDLSLSAAPPLANDDVGTPSTITGDSGSVAADTSFATRAATDPPKPTTTTRTLWFRWTAPRGNLTGNTHVRFTARGASTLSPDTFLFAFPETGGTTMATAVAYNDDADLAASDRRAAMTFRWTSGTTYRILAGTSAGHGPFTLAWSLTTAPTPPPNDDFAAEAGQISGPSGSTDGNNQAATAEPQDPNGSVSTGGGHSVWFHWTAPADGAYYFRTQETTTPGIDTSLRVLVGDTLPGLIQIAANNDAPGVTTSEVLIEASEGTTYHVMVDGWPSRTRGAFRLAWERIQPVGTTTAVAVTSPAPGLVDVTATVSRSDSLTPTGWVVVYDGDDPLLPHLPVVSGTATGRFRHQAGGAHTYTARFTPDDYFQAESTSAPVTLDVVGRPRPTHDDFADAATISGGTGTAGPVDLLAATREAGEPRLAPDAESSVWYRWTAPVSDAFTFTVSSADPEVDSVVGALRGSALGDLTELRSSSHPAGPGSEITFSAIEGRTYHLLVDAVFPGTVSLAWSRAGGPATTTDLTATSPGPYAYDLAAEVTGATDGDVVFLRDGAVVGHVSTTDGTAVLSRTFQQPGASVFLAEFYPDDPAVRPSGSAEESLVVTAPPAPPNDRFVNAVDISGATSAAGTTDGATLDPGTPPSGLLSPGAGTSVWYRWVAPSDGSFEFTATRGGAPTDTVLRAFEGTSLGTLRTLHENDDAGGIETSRVGISARQGRTYYLLVDAYRFTTMGSFTLTWAASTVTPAATTTALTAAATGRTVTLRAAVDDPTSTNGLPGYVEFYEGAASRGVVPVSADGVAVHEVTGVLPGQHTYRAVFVPDDYRFAQSTSPDRTVTVLKSATRTTLSAPARAARGAKPTVAAVVRMGSANATGSVRFTLNGRVLRTVALRAGRATVRLPALAPGRARVVASYRGSTVAAPSSATRTIVVSTRR